MTLAFRKHGSLGVPTVLLTGMTSEKILDYAQRHDLEFMPTDWIELIWLRLPTINVD